MNLLAPETVLSVFAIFCRVGGCVMVAPGFSSSQVPTRIRLYIAVAISLALAPMLLDTVRPSLGGGSGVAVLGLVFSELAVGVLIGFVTRLLFLALQMMTVAITQAIGLSAMPGTQIEDSDQQPALSTFFSVAVTTLMFVAGLHAELVRGVVDSYATIPPGIGFVVRPALAEVADKAGAAFLATIRIGSPFIIYSIVVNFAIGFTNKLVPQIPVFFIATPFVMAGGLFLLLLTAHDFMSAFIFMLDNWLTGN